MNEKPIGLDLVAYVPDWSLTFEEDWKRYREEYFKVYGEYPPSARDKKPAPPSQRSG